MEARLIVRKYSLLIVFNSVLMAALMSGNTLAQSFGLTPSKELVRRLRTRSSRAGRKIETLFQN
jgi:hypothetical protein